MSPRILSHLADLLSRAWPPAGRRRLLFLVAPPALAAAGLCAALVFGAPGGRLGPGAQVAPGQPAGGAAAAGDAEGAAAVPPPAGLLVEVSGAVARPGMYRVAKGERVSAAVAAAGGLAPDADPDRLPNLAARLKDGQQVVVPRLGAPGRTAAGTGQRITRVSLNLASADQLAAVPGFTPALAAAVIAYRTQYGGFSTTQELVDVLQMSAADYAVARRYVRV
jgi:competence protein ComEA